MALTPTPVPLTRQSVNQFMQTAGFDPDAADAALSAQVFDEVQRFLSRDLPGELPFSGAGRGQTSYTRDAGAAGFASGCVWVLGMALVLWQALRHFRRRRIRAAARQRQTLESLNLLPGPAPVSLGSP